MSVGPGEGGTLGCPYYQRPGDPQLAPRTWVLVGLVAWPAWSSQACRGRSAPPTWWSQVLGTTRSRSLCHFCERMLLPFLESLP